MQRYFYSISLRVGHPSIAPEEITHALGIQPKRVWQAGQQRKTPKGKLLEGVYRESYWCADPFSLGEYSSTDNWAEDTLIEVLEVLESHKAFIQQLRNEGGRISLWIKSYSGRSYALEFSPELLGRCAELGVSLIHDIYPYE